MNTVKELRGGDRGEGDLFSRVGGDDAIPVEPAALRRDQDARIDQRRHGDFGDFGSFGCLRVIAASSFQ